MSDEYSFGMIAKNRRRELGLTQDELARRVGCAPITLRKIEADDLRPSVQIAERMAMALNIPLEERAAFVKLARTERTPFEEPKVTPMPAFEEIGSEDLSGRAIRGYALGERLGNGGMGVVYRAVQPLVEREVAIKIILPQYANHPDFIRRFEAEAQLVARLEHPHIVPLYDYWREPSVAYLIMRLLRGGSVQSMLRNGTALTPEAVLRMMEQIGSALSSAHRAGIVHRDLKPANVLLDEDNNAYLADFGIAKNLSSPSSDTQADMVIGSPDYISPEQIKSEFVRPQTDIYALGVMLYELLTGRVPFHGPTPFEVMHQHLSTPLPALAVNRSGLPKALDAVIEHATAKDPLQRYETVDMLLDDLRKALGHNLREIKSNAVTSQPTAIPLTPMDNPYKGLRAFGEGDAQDFYGREALTQQLLVRLGEGGELARFLAVVGPSGSGKSSVVKAGLIPALRRGALPGSENWFIVEMLPGAHPLEELEAALLRVAVNPPASLMEQFQKDSRGLIRAVRRSLPNDPTIELVLVIDQFEEVFTLLRDEKERLQFLELLVSAMLDQNSRVRVVLTLRADFIDRPLNYVDFGELLHQRMELVLPLTPDELENAITAPAERVGLHFETGLVSAILHDIGDQPGTLPLLQYALTELYEKRAGNTLTKSVYREIGGVLGALGRRAEEIFTGLDGESQTIAKQLFLRLVTLGEGVEDTRRRALIAELANLQLDHAIDAKNYSKSFQKVLDSFGKARLLSFDRDPDTRGSTVEVAHEAIIREWTRLREWLNESRTQVRMQRQLAQAAAEWENAQQDESFLLTGTKLAQYAGWTTGSTIALTQYELDYLNASVVARDQREMEEGERQKRELETAQKLAETERVSVLRLRGRNRVISLVSVIALVLAVFAGILAFRSNQSALQATSRELAAASISNLDIDPELSILLALQGLSVQHTSEAEDALRQSLATSRVKWTLTSKVPVSSTAFSPDGKYLAAGGEKGIVQIWDVQTGQEIASFDATSLINGIEYTHDGKQIITEDSSGYVKLWDSSTGKLNSWFRAHSEGYGQMTLSADGKRMATTSSSAIKIWDIKTSKELFKLSGTGNISSVAFSNDGTRLATASHNGNVIIWDPATGGKLLEFLASPNDCIPEVLFNKDTTGIVTSDDCGTIRFWDITSNKSRELFHRNVNAAGGHIPLTLSRDGGWLAVSDNHSVSIWDASTGFDLLVLPFGWYVNGADFSPDGKLFAAGGYSTIIKVWDLSMPSEKLAITAHDGNRIGDVAFSPDGTQLVTESLADGKVKLWNFHTGKEILTINDSDICCVTAFSPNGLQLVIGSNEGVAKIRDATTGDLVNELAGHTNSVVQVAFNPDGTRIATASSDGSVKIWDATNSQLLNNIIVNSAGGVNEVNDVAFSPDGRLLATSATDMYSGNQVTIWDATSGKLLFLLGYDPNNLFSAWGLAFSSDGKQLAVGYADNVARIWDISEMKSQKQPLLTLRGHSNNVWDVAYSPDGSRLATASFDGTVKIWNVSPGPEQGKEITTLSGHTAEVSGVVFSPDGKYLASVSWDGTLRVYYTQLEDLIAAAKKRVARFLATEECQKYLHVDTCPAAP